MRKVGKIFCLHLGKKIPEIKSTSVKMYVLLKIVEIRKRSNIVDSRGEKRDAAKSFFAQTTNFQLYMQKFSPNSILRSECARKLQNSNLRKHLPFQSQKFLSLEM